MSQMSLITEIKPKGPFSYCASACLCYPYPDLLRTNQLFIYFFENSSNRLHEDRELVSPRQLARDTLAGRTIFKAFYHIFII